MWVDVAVQFPFSVNRASISLPNNDTVTESDDSVDGRDREKMNCFFYLLVAVRPLIYTHPRDCYIQI